MGTPELLNQKDTISGIFDLVAGSGQRPLKWIRTTDPRVISQNPESVPFVRRALQTLVPAPSAGVSRPDEHWSMLAGHAAVPQGDDIGNR